MRLAFEAFLEELDELEGFVTSLDRVYGLLASHEDPTVRNCVNVRKRLDYGAFFVALYAAFERFVEDLAWSHAELESASVAYAELPGKLPTRHLRQSAELLFRSRLGEGRYRGLSELDVVRNLHACLSGKTPYQLNRHAVVQHEGNLRADIVQKLFAELGVDSLHAAVRRCKPMTSWFAENRGAGEAGSEREVPETLIDLRLKDLVDRRNDVAHRSEGLDAIDSAEMRTRLQFMKAYASALFSALAGIYLTRRHLQGGSARSLGSFLEGPLKGRMVVVVRKPKFLMYVGQPLLTVSRDRVDAWGEVRELRVNDQLVERLEADAPVEEVGVRADFPLGKKSKLYALETKDAAVWELSADA